MYDNLFLVYAPPGKKNCCKPVTGHWKTVVSMLQATGRILMIAVFITSDNICGLTCLLQACLPG